MRKLWVSLMICGFLAAVCWSFGLLADRQKLKESLIRFHVVAHSDSAEDQAVKLTVRDAVLDSLKTDLQKISDMGEARRYLQDSLPKIRDLVDGTLKELGFEGSSRVSLCKESFDVRHYDTFSLPSGAYESLRIVIGDGQGRNWWCVSFPALCLPATATGFEDAAVGAGFSQPLTRTLSGQDGYELRFFLLDQLGKLENIFIQE